MAIRGSLREAGAVDILQLLALGRKTGCLSLSDGISFGRVYLEDGLITNASIVNRPDRLGELLVKNGLISAAELSRAILEQEGSRSRIGEILVARGSVPADEVDRLVRLQIEEAIYLLFTWSQGQFHFEPDELPPPGETRVRLHPESLLLEGARRVDEWTLIEKKIPSSRLVFSLDLTHGIPDYAELSPEQRRVLILIDGKRCVGEVVRESGLLEFDGYRAVFGLLQAGYVRAHGELPEPIPALPSESSVEGHRNLATAFRRTGMAGEARRELLRILELAPDDSEARLRLAEIELLRGEFRTAARRAMEVARAHPDESEGFYIVALALEGADRIEEASATVDAALASAPGDADLLLSRAVISTRSGDLPAACAAFATYERARDEALAPPPAYYIYSVIAFAGVGRGDAAAQRARAGVRRYPRNASLLTNAGALAERRGELEQAEDLFRRALDADPTLPQAKRGLAEVLFSRGNHSAAGALFAELLEVSLAPADVHHRLGEISYLQNDAEGAIHHLELALAADPAHLLATSSLEQLRSSFTAGR